MGGQTFETHCIRSTRRSRPNKGAISLVREIVHVNHVSHSLRNGDEALRQYCSMGYSIVYSVLFVSCADYQQHGHGNDARADCDGIVVDDDAR